MKNIEANLKTKENKIIENFFNSDLTIEQYINACKQYLYSQRNDTNFVKMLASEQENYLMKNNILGYRFLGDKNLVEILKSLDNISLTEIYSIITLNTSRLGFTYQVNIDFSSLLNNKDSILIVNAEMFLNQISKLCSLGKKITLWTSNTFIQELLIFDFGNIKDVSVNLVDIYNNDYTETTKFENIICIPPFGLKRRFTRGKHYGNDASTIAAELLIKNNLSDNGILTIIMPIKVNFSQLEVHFRAVFGNNLREVVSLPVGTFSNTGIKTYLYKFSKKKSEDLFISDSVNVIGEKFNISDVTNIDTTWDFEKPFKEVDQDILNVLSKEHQKLSDISEILRGKPLSKYAQEVTQNEDFVYIDMRAIKEENIDFSELKKYVIDKDLSSEYLQDGDLLIQNKGNISKIVLFKNTGKNCIASANLLIIRPNKESISSEYLLLYLRSDIGQKLIKGLQRGASMSFISHEDLKGIAVVVPTLEKQNNFLQSYNLKMEKYKKQLEQVKNEISQLEQEVNKFICE